MSETPNDEMHPEEPENPDNDQSSDENLKADSQLRESASTTWRSIHIQGDVSGVNVNIGGTQNIHVKRHRGCPTPPKAPAHFAGRRDEIDHLKTLLRQGQNAAVTGVQGMGGIGKTALAQKLANELTEFSAVLWASVGQNPSAVDNLISWAQYADPQFVPDDQDKASSEHLAQRVQALLTNLINDECPGPVLIIFDDVWEEEGVRAVRLLQKAVPVNSVTLQRDLSALSHNCAARE
jgi:hypothetical protein